MARGPSADRWLAVKMVLVLRTGLSIEVVRRAAREQSTIVVRHAETGRELLTVHAGELRLIVDALVGTAPMNACDRGGVAAKVQPG